MGLCVNMYLEKRSVMITYRHTTVITWQRREVDQD